MRCESKKSHNHTGQPGVLARVPTLLRNKKLRRSDEHG
jgi:hypothetical protein